VNVELPPQATASGRLAEVAMHDDLDPLRQRHDFKKLLAELEAKQE
jgi:hypothetical protein